MFRNISRKVKHEQLHKEALERGGSSLLHQYKNGPFAPGISTNLSDGHYYGDPRGVKHLRGARQAW